MEKHLTQSRWLTEAKRDNLLRDPVDAMNDAEALVEFLHGRLDALFKERATGSGVELARDSGCCAHSARAVRGRAKP